MDTDQVILIFIVEYYENLQNNRQNIGSVYAEGAKLLVYNKDKPVMQCKSNFQTLLPLGNRKILSYDGEIIQKTLFVHVKSSLATPGSTDIVDEAFTCTLTDSSMLITYHSIHINPFLGELPPLPPPPVKVAPPPKVEPKPAPPPPKPAVEVKGPKEFDGQLSVLVKNLPYKIPPSEFVPEMSKRFGRVVKFCQGSGKLVAQFETRKQRNEAVHAPEIEWNGRIVRIIGLPQNLQWD